VKGVILAGGTGSRLRPITYTEPKQLIPVANKPVLEYAIDDLRDAGITEIGVVLGQHGADAIQRTLGDGSDLGVDLTYIVQGAPLGLAHAVGCAREFVGDDPFVVYLGDDLLGGNISELVASFDPETHAASIAVKTVDDPSRYGIVDRDDRGDVVSLVEKPDDPPGTSAIIGVYVFTPAIFEYIDGLASSWRGEFEITDAIQRLLDGGHRVQSHTIGGWWKDTGTPEDIVHANRLVLDAMEPEVHGDVDEDATVDGRVEVGEKSIIEAGSTIRGPVSIGENVRIRDGAYIGPYTSIGDNCVVERVHLEASVVMDGATVTTTETIVDSLLGPNTSVTARDADPRGGRLVIGRDTEVDL
jgi:glucose-1-phosphate thymidylyltransferase